MSESENSDAVHPQSGRVARAKPKEFEVVVEEVIRETPDSTTLVYAERAEPSIYEAGQFITIRPQQFAALDRFCRYFEDVKGKREPARAYSLTSAPHEARLAITIKEETYVSGVTKYPPILSPFLTYRVTPGMRMTVTGFGGPYFVPSDLESQTDYLLHVCAGSGIVPNYSILKHCLETGRPFRHVLVYGNKTWEDVIFRRQLEELAARFPDRFSIVHALSREPEPEKLGPNVRRGRVGIDLLREFVPDPNALRVFTCGPGIGPFERQAAKEKGEEPTPRFLETALAALRDLGIPDKRIHRESYG
jgi:3-ketosteroid 9alpha-monooxygenase subunit B